MSNSRGPIETYGAALRKRYDAGTLNDDHRAATLISKLCESIEAIGMDSLPVARLGQFIENGRLGDEVPDEAFALIQSAGARERVQLHRPPGFRMQSMPASPPSVSWRIPLSVAEWCCAEIFPTFMLCRNAFVWAINLNADAKFVQDVEAVDQRAILMVRQWSKHLAAQPNLAHAIQLAGAEVEIGDRRFGSVLAAAVALTDTYTFGAQGWEEDVSSPDELKRVMISWLDVAEIWREIVHLEQFPNLRARAAAEQAALMTFATAEGLGRNAPQLAVPKIGAQCAPVEFMPDSEQQMIISQLFERHGAMLQSQFADMSPKTVARAMPELLKHGLVARVAKRKGYRLTESGIALARKTNPPKKPEAGH